jgi:hypothetical protein
VRSTAHGISAASGKAGAIIAAQGFSSVANSNIGIRGVLGIFTVCCFLGLIFTFWVPETKGKSLEELSTDFALQPPSDTSEVTTSINSTPSPEETDPGKKEEKQEKSKSKEVDDDKSSSGENSDDESPKPESESSSNV